MARTDTTASTGAPVLPEILRSRQLAAILTPIIWEMADEAAKRFEAQHLGRYMAEPLAAIRALVHDVRRYHSLPAIDPRTGVPFGGDEAAAVAFLDGSAPEPERAEVKS